MLGCRRNPFTVLCSITVIKSDRVQILKPSFRAIRLCAYLAFPEKAIGHLRVPVELCAWLFGPALETSFRTGIGAVHAPILYQF
jgi:hypothetical protein